METQPGQHPHYIAPEAFPAREDGSPYFKLVETAGSNQLLRIGDQLVRPVHGTYETNEIGTVWFALTGDLYTYLCRITPRVVLFTSMTNGIPMPFEATPEQVATGLAGIADIVDVRIVDQEMTVRVMRGVMPVPKETYLGTPSTAQKERGHLSAFHCTSETVYGRQVMEEMMRTMLADAGVVTVVA